MNSSITHYDAWDDVFNYREYLELGTSGNNCNSNHNCGNGGCGFIILMAIVLYLYYWWLL